MRAVMFNGPYDVSIGTIPYPEIQDPKDVVLKVFFSALCGSDLHFYRGHAQQKPGTVQGHEFVGMVVQRGDEVKNFELGDKVIVPFATSCGECFYCERSQSSRCSKGQVFGTPELPGGQAEFVRCPLADSTMVKISTNIPIDRQVLMADVFPTGFFAASRFLNTIPVHRRSQTTVVCVGCGPVGICAIASALGFVDTVYAVESVPQRLEQAARLGAITINLDQVDPVSRIKEATEGRGADVVIEAVGQVCSLRLAMDLIRPFGCISAIGVQSKATVFGPELYDKNAQIAFGRCPVRSIFEEAFEAFHGCHNELAFLCGEKRSLDDAQQAYTEFEERRVHKVVFDLGE